MNRALALVAATTIVSVALPLSAASAAHQGQMGCPPPFDALTEAEQYELAEEAGVPPEEVVAALEAVDKNGDRVLCFLPLPTGHANVVDNRSGIT